MAFVRPISFSVVSVVLALVAIESARHETPASAASGVERSVSSAPGVAIDFDGYDQFGFARDGFDVRDGIVRRNETLSDILQSFGTSAPAIAELAARARGTFDVRDIRAGRPIHVYLRGNEVAGMVYEPSSLAYVVFELEPEPRVGVWKRPVLIRRRTAQGTIRHSLYETLEEADADLGLAFELAEIFAWQIDFYHLLPGDRFTAIYDQRYVHGQSVGVGTVHAARFVHGGREFSAYHFDRQGEIAYFDEEGNSLRKSFLAAPVKYSRISSRYSGRRYHPVLKRYRAHLGTDYAAPRGTPIRATGDGEVVAATYKGNNGRYVKIRHNGTYATAYLHMSRIANGIGPGVFVRQGDVIGYVGSTGLARGNHVCYRFWKHGRQVDPLRETFPSAEPVLEENLESFRTVKARLEELLLRTRRSNALPYYALLLK